MSDIYTTLAEGYEKLAAGFRALAGQDKPNEKTPDAPAEAPLNAQEAPKKGKKKLTKEAVRAVMTTKSENGKTQEIKALLLKYGASKLTDLDPEHYEAFLAEVEAL